MQRACLIIGFALAASGPAWADSSQEVLVAARDAYKARDEAALVESHARLQAENYPLAPYVEYWRMLLRLEQADATEVRSFLTRYADFPFSERIRTEWLKKLAKRQEWPLFFEEQASLNVEDTAVSCQALVGRAVQGDDSAMAQGKPLWLTSSDQPSDCDALFDRMAKSGVLTTDDIWARARLALEQGRTSVAKAALKRLPQLDAASLKLLDKAYENPQRVLEKKTFTSKTRLGRELNLYALDRVSRSQPELALELWLDMKGAYPQAEQQYLWSRMALHASRRHDPRALDWYDKAGDVALDPDQMAWKARAALRARQWDAILRTIAAMPPDMQQEPVWRYWNGRALKEKGQTVAANASLLPLSRERTYYGLLAEEEIGDIISSAPASYTASKEDVQAVRNLPGVQRALELHRLDMRWESRNEWAWAMRGMSDRQLIAAAEVAFREEWYDIAINTAEKTALTHDFAMRYPTPYREKMQAYVRENGLDEAWVYGLIRQESRFISYARSGVGAAGLMQVMPATAKWIARRMGLDDYHHGMIDQLDTNIQFGTHYLRYALDQMEGQPLMATAAYNAGPGRARKWASEQPLEGAIYAETIPFSETRNYVQKVMGNAYFYAHRLGTRIQTLKQRLGMVAYGGPAVASENEKQPE
jgi:soluble lytic murein transglycosylase